MLKQLVPSDFCLKCQGCCRFAQNPSIWAPSGCQLVKNNGEYLCANLQADNHCRAYSRHPLDCQLYPFLLVRKGNSLRLGLHKACSFIAEHKMEASALKEYTEYLKERLRTDKFVAALQNNPEMVADYQEEVELIADLSDIVNPGKSVLQPLTINNKALVESNLRKNKSALSSHHFASIFIWSGLYKIFWTIIQENLCIFYQDALGMFMPLPPLGVPPSSETIRRCFGLMNSYNQNSEISRIENVAEEDLRYYEQSGCKAKLKDREYLCLRESIANLSGEAFKHKRASYNHFKKNYKAKVVEYDSSLYQECLVLYQLWMAQRKDKFRDSIYQQMLEDSFSSFETALKSYDKLGLIGNAVKIEGKVKACSFGYPLTAETFCILFEVCNLKYKGIAQFIFSEFCKNLTGYKHINIMGSSELENLKSAKLSYHPEKSIGVNNIYENPGGAVVDINDNL